ncbi:hypothetical protein SZ39_2627 [Bacillus mycoides]|nr:hypothetical protein SZ39_2627 [Bacillus mycoides]
MGLKQRYTVYKKDESELSTLCFFLIALTGKSSYQSYMLAIN